MPIKDDMSNLADRAKWKANQQMRLLNLHNSITQQEGKIKVQKANLADETVKRFYENQLNDDVLKPICEQIKATYNEIDNLKGQEIATRNEKPPENVNNYSVASPLGEVGISTSGLICPKCGRALRGEFCPIDGTRGVPKATPEPQIQASSGLPSADPNKPVLVCPICKKQLASKFCNQHGVEGVPLG